MMPSNRLTLCCPFLPPPSVFPRIRLVPAGGQSTGASASAPEWRALQETSFSAVSQSHQGDWQCPTCSSAGELSLPLPLPLFLSFVLQWTPSPSVSRSGSVFTSLLVLFLAAPRLHACAHWLRVCRRMSLLFSPFCPCYPTSGCALAGYRALRLSPKSPYFPPVFYPSALEDESLDQRRAWYSSSPGSSQMSPFRSQHIYFKFPRSLISSFISKPILAS